MATKPLPPQDELNQLLRYSPDTGTLYWRPRPRSMFHSERSFKIWNTQFSNKEAGCAAGEYRKVSINNAGYLSHRVIYKMVYNQEPPHIDHINHSPSDNRIWNLAASNSLMNSKNSTMHKDNTSGHNGVSWDKQTCKWRAHITVERKIKCLGRYEDIGEAISARELANQKYKFHDNHGKPK